MKQPYQHIFLSENHTINLFVPITGGQYINTNNTCQYAKPIQAFLKGGALRSLMLLQKDITENIEKLAKDSEERKTEEQHLKQASSLIDILQRVSREDSGIARMTRLDEHYPELPDSIKSFIKQHEDSNLKSMLLNPKFPSGWIRSTNHSFTVDRDLSSPLTEALQKINQPAALDNMGYFLSKLKEKFPDAGDDDSYQHNLIAYINGAQTIIDEMIESGFMAMSSEESNIRQLVGEKFGASGQLSNEEFEKKLTENLSAIVMEENLTNTAPSEILENMVNSIKDSLESSNQLKNPFFNSHNYESNEDSANRIIYQFLLGTANLLAQGEKLTTANWGAILGENQTLCDDLKDTILNALASSEKNVMGDIISFINKNAQTFQTEKISPAFEKKIAKIFMQNWTQIKEWNRMPHFDDFTMICPDVKGPFVSYNSNMCFHFGYYIKSGFPDIYEEHKTLIDAMIASFDSLNIHLSPESSNILTPDTKPTSLIILLKSKNLDAAAHYLISTDDWDVSLLQAYPEKMALSISALNLAQSSSDIEKAVSFLKREERVRAFSHVHLLRFDHLEHLTIQERAILLSQNSLEFETDPITKRVSPGATIDNIFHYLTPEFALIDQQLQRVDLTKLDLSHIEKIIQFYETNGPQKGTENVALQLLANSIPDKVRSRICPMISTKFAMQHAFGQRGPEGTSPPAYNDPAIFLNSQQMYSLLAHFKPTPLRIYYLKKLSVEEINFVLTNYDTLPFRNEDKIAVLKEVFSAFKSEKHIDKIMAITQHLDLQDSDKIFLIERIQEIAVSFEAIDMLSPLVPKDTFLSILERGPLNVNLHDLCELINGYSLDVQPYHLSYFIHQQLHHFDQSLSPAIRLILENTTSQDTITTLTSLLSKNIKEIMSDVALKLPYKPLKEFLNTHVDTLKFSHLKHLEPYERAMFILEWPKGFEIHKDPELNKNPNDLIDLIFANLDGQLDITNSLIECINLEELDSIRSQKVLSFYAEKGMSYKNSHASIIRLFSNANPFDISKLISAQDFEATLEHEKITLSAENLTALLKTYNINGLKIAHIKHLRPSEVPAMLANWQGELEPQLTTREKIASLFSAYSNTPQTIGYFLDTLDLGQLDQDIKHRVLEFYVQNISGMQAHNIHKTMQYICDTSAAQSDETHEHLLGFDFFEKLQQNGFNEEITHIKSCRIFDMPYTLSLHAVLFLGKQKLGIAGEKNTPLLEWQWSKKSVLRFLLENVGNLHDLNQSSLFGFMRSHINHAGLFDAFSQPELKQIQLAIPAKSDKTFFNLFLKEWDSHQKITMPLSTSNIQNPPKDIDISPKSSSQHSPRKPCGGG